MSIKSLINTLNGKAFVMLVDIQNCISGCAIAFTDAKLSLFEGGCIIIENQNRDNIRLDISSISNIGWRNDEYVIKTDEADITISLS